MSTTSRLPARRRITGAAFRGGGGAMVRIRPARAGDAQAVARIYVEGWQNAYPALLPEEFLLGMRAGERRSLSWARTIGRPGSTEHVLVAEATDGDNAGRVIGFASGGSARYGGLSHDSEVYTLYVEGDFHGQGIGRRLFATLAVALAGRGGPSVIVWVLDGNPARYFYEALDGQLVGRRAGTIGGAAIEEIAYGWPDATVLAARQR